MRQFRLISVTAILSLLIWTMAAQLLSDQVGVQVTVVPKPVGGSGMIVQTVPPEANQFSVTLSGPTRLVDQVRSDAPLSIEIPVPDVRPNGHRSIDVRKELAEYPALFHGLLVESVDPPEIQVLIDHETTVTMPVDVEYGDLEFQVPPRVEPAEVEVTISELTLAGLEEEQRRVVLNVEKLLRGKPAGEPLREAAPLLPQRLGQANVRIEPHSVIVFATLAEQSTTATIPAVPILVAASFDTFNKFRLQSRDGTTLITRAITVQGPPAVLDRLVAGSTRVTGLIVLTSDLASEVGDAIELEPQFDLPPEVRLVERVAPVEFELLPTEP